MAEMFTRNNSLSPWQFDCEGETRELVKRGDNAILANHSLQIRLTRWNDFYGENQEALQYWSNGMLRFEGWYTVLPTTNAHTLSPYNNRNRPAPF